MSEDVLSTFLQLPSQEDQPRKYDHFTVRVQMGMLMCSDRYVIHSLESEENFSLFAILHMDGV